MAGSSASRAPLPWFWLQGLVCGGMLATVPGTAIFMVVLLAPAIIGYAMDNASGKPHFRVIVLLGTASAFAPLLLLWKHSGSLEAALDLLSDPVRPLLSWFCCGAGWLLTELAQMTAKLTITGRHTRTMKSLEAERDGLVEEWLDAKPPRS